LTPSFQQFVTCSQQQDKPLRGSPALCVLSVCQGWRHGRPAIAFGHAPALRFGCHVSSTSSRLPRHHCLHAGCDEDS
jgi:hypothetical protein